MVKQRPRSKEMYGLFNEARRGDASARNILLNRLRPPVFRWIRNRVSGAIATHALAEDLAQDVLIRINEALEECEAGSEAQFMAWVFTIARHVVIDWRRREPEEVGRRYEAGQLDGLVVSADVSGAVGSEADRLLGKVLLEAQAGLSPGTQEVIRQRLLYGATWRAAGEAAGTTAGGAKRRWQRATRHLRREVLRRAETIGDDELRREVLRRLKQEPEADLPKQE